VPATFTVKVNKGFVADLEILHHCRDTFEELPVYRVRPLGSSEGGRKHDMHAIIGADAKDAFDCELIVAIDECFRGLLLSFGIGHGGLKDTRRTVDTTTTSEDVSPAYLYRPHLCIIS